MHATLPKLLQHIVETYPETAIQMSKDESGVFQSISYTQFYAGNAYTPLA